MNRRRLLLSTGAIMSASTAGCLTSDSDESEDPEDPDNPENPEDSEDPNIDLEEPGDPTYIVASDGSEDYEKLSDAYRVSEDDDVIAVRSGDYELELNKEINVYFVGDGIGETTISLVGGEHSFSRITVGFYDLSLLSKEDSFIDMNADLVFDSVKTEVPVAGWSGGGDGTITAKNSEFSPPRSGPGTYIGRNPINVGTIHADECEFNCSVKLDSSFSIYNSSFDEEFVLEGLASGSMDNSVLNGILFKWIKESSEFTNCEINPIPDTNIAIDHDDGRTYIEGKASSGRNDFINNTINGKIECEGIVPGNVIGNVFEGENVEWYIDGIGPRKLYRNAFINGSIRYDHDSEIYNEDEQIGNFYSGHDNEDEDGDGIADLPRPIAGDAGLTDRYPLASPDVDEY